MKRFISFIGVIVILLLASFLYLVKQPFVQEQLKTALKNYVQQSFAHHIEFKSVELSLWGPSIVGKSIHLTNETEDLFFDSVKARISLLGLIRSKLEIASVTASHGKITLNKDWKAPQFAGVDEKESFSLIIPRIYFKDLAFQYRTDSKFFHFKEARVTAKALWGRIDIDFEIPLLGFETKNGKKEDIRIEAGLTVDPRRLRVHKLKILDEENFLTSSGTIYFEKDLINLDLQFRTEFELAEFHFIDPKIDFLKGKALFEGKIKNTQVKPKIQANVSSQELMFYNQPLNKFRAQFVYDDDKLDISHYSIGSVAEGNVHLALDKFLSATGSAHFSSFPLETVIVLKDLGLSGLGLGNINFDFKTEEGEKFNLKLLPDLEISNFSSSFKDKFDLPQFAIKSDVLINPQVIAAHQAQIKIAETQWNIPSLEINLKDKTILGNADTTSFDWTHFKIASWTKNLLGHGKVALEVKGPLAHPFILGKVDLAQNELEKLKLSHIQGALKYQAPWVFFEDLKLSSGDSYLFLKGRYHSEKQVFDKTVIETDKFFASDIESFGYKLPFDFKGTLRGKASFYGPLTREGVSVRSNLVGEHAKIAQESFDFFQLNFQLQNGVFSLSDTFLDKGEGRVFLNGKVFKDNKCHIKFWTKNLVSESFDVIAKYPFIFSSDVLLEGFVDGDIANPFLKTSLEFKNASLNGERLPSSSYVLTLKDKKLEIQGNILERAARVEGKLTLSEPMPFEVYLKGKNFDFKLFYGLWRGYVSDGSGVINGSLRLKGMLDKSFSNPKINYAAIDLDRFEFKLPGYSLVNEKKFTLKYDDNFLEIQGVSLKGTDTNFSFAGKTDDRGNLNFLGKGRLNVAFLPLFFKEFEFGEGLVDLELSIQGDKDDPEFHGKVATKGSSLRSRTLDQTFDNIHLYAILDQKKLKFQAASFKMSEGSGSLEGDIDFPQLFSPQCNIQVHLNKGVFTFLDKIRLKAGGKILIQGFSPLRVGGDLRVFHAKIMEDLDWKRHLFQKEDLAQSRPSKEKQQPIDLNLHVKLEDKTQFESNIMNATLRGDINLKGNTLKPLVSGHMEVIDGNVTFKDNVFKFNSGQVSFQDQEKLNPAFKFVIESKIRKYEIQVSGSGTLDEYELQFQSEPPLPQADVVSLITLGIMVSELQEEGGLQTTSIEAASLLFSEFKERFKYHTKEKLGLDFRLSSSFSDTRHAVRPRIFVSKDLGKNLEASFSSTLDKENIFEDKVLNLEWKLNKGFSLLGVWEDESQETQDAASAFGLDMKYKYEFR